VKGKTEMLHSILGPDMFSSPHVASSLVRMFDEKWQLEPDEFRQLIDHLSTCTNCQRSLGLLFLASVDKFVSKGEYDDEVQAILVELKEVIHETQVLQDLSGYADTLERNGIRKARKQYPEFAEHVKYCKECQQEVKNTRKLIREADKDGLLVLVEKPSS